VDRQRLQVALTSLGFDTRGSDGIFGPRSREMILGWQKSRNEPTTGFLNAPQQQALLKEGAPAVTKFDDQLKKAEEEKKKAEEEAKARNLATAAPAGGTVPAPSRPDGAYKGDTSPAAVAVYDGKYAGVLPRGVAGQIGPFSWGGVGGSSATSSFLTVEVRVEIAGGRGSGTVKIHGCRESNFSFTISSSGNITGEGTNNCDDKAVTVVGRGERETLDLTFASKGIGQQPARALLTRSK
jgi:hypothetical protein